MGVVQKSSMCSQLYLLFLFVTSTYVETKIYLVETGLRNEKAMEEAGEDYVDISYDEADYSTEEFKELEKDLLPSKNKKAKEGNDYANTKKKNKKKKGKEIKKGKEDKENKKKEKEQLKKTS